MHALALLREQEDQALKDKILHAQKQQEEQAVARASRKAHRKMLSDQWKLEKVVRKFMAQQIRKGMSDAAAILETMSQAGAGARETAPEEDSESDSDEWDSGLRICETSSDDNDDFEDL